MFLQIVVSSSKENLLGPQLRLCDGSWHFAELIQSKEKVHFRLDEFSKTVSGSNLGLNEISKNTIGATGKGQKLLCSAKSPKKFQMMKVLTKPVVANRGQNDMIRSP